MKTFQVHERPYSKASTFNLPPEAQGEASGRSRMVGRVAAGVLHPSGSAQGSLAGDKADRGDEKAVQERNETFVAAFNNGDIKAMAACYAPDCDFLSAVGQRVKGRDALEKYFAKGFAESKGLKLKHTHSSLRFLNPDVAIDDGAWEITGRPEGRRRKDFIRRS